MHKTTQSRALIFTLAIVITLGIVMAAIPLDQRIDASRVNAAASVLVAAGTMALAFVTFYQIQTTRQQSLETQQAQVRPLLVPQSEINAYATQSIWRKSELPYRSQKCRRRCSREYLGSDIASK